MPDFGRWKRILIKRTEVAVQIVAMASIDVYKLWHFFIKKYSEKEFEKRREDMMGDWVYNDCGNDGQIMHYKITYTDEWGRECDVEIEY